MYYIIMVFSEIITFNNITEKAYWNKLLCYKYLKVLCQVTVHNFNATLLKHSSLHTTLIFNQTIHIYKKVL